MNLERFGGEVKAGGWWTEKMAGVFALPMPGLVRFHRCCKPRTVLKGHGFSRAAISESTEAQTMFCSVFRQRGNVKLNNLQLLNALLYVAEHGCKWRGLPKRFGNWHTIYTRMNRWSKNGCWIRSSSSCSASRSCASASSREPGFDYRQSTPRRHRRVKNGPQAIGKSRGGWTTKIHMVAADARTAITFALSPGQASDAVEARRQVSGFSPCGIAVYIFTETALAERAAAPRHTRG